MVEKRKTNIVNIFIVIAGLLWIIFSRTPANSGGLSQQSIPKKNFQAPDFSLQTPGEEEIQLSKLKGKAVLINFWASWCTPCRAEMPAIERIYRDYKDYGLEVLAVNTTYQDSLPDVQNFVKDYALTFPILLDQTGEISNLYQIRALPTSFFINPEGIIIEVVIGGPMAEALIRTRIENILPIP